MSSSSSSSNNNNNNGGKVNGLGSIPATSRKMVQSLKEIVNYPENEIYAMLKECNMDPNDTVNRLLSQDTFHEVKSKREKKKEIKEGSESRSRGVTNSSNRGGRGGSDRNVARGGSTQFNSTESGVSRAKLAYKKENGANTIPSTSSAAGMVENNFNHRYTSLSDHVSTESTVQVISKSDGISLSSQLPTGFQPTWLGAPGQVSMADIVKMGRPKQRAFNLPIAAMETSYSPQNANMPNTSQYGGKHTPVYPSPTSESCHDLHSSKDRVSNISGIIHEPSIPVDQHISPDGWSLVEKSLDPNGSSFVEPTGASTVFADPSSLTGVHANKNNLHLTSGSDEPQVTDGNMIVEDPTVGCVGSASASDGHKRVESSGEASCFDESSFETCSSHQPQRLAFGHQEGIGGNDSHLSSVQDGNVAVSSAAASLQQMSLRKEEVGAMPVVDNPAVIIPNHLQVTTADCSHLSFGSFGSGISATFSGSYISKNVKNNLEDTSVAADVSSLEHADTRNTENYGNESLTTTTNDNVDTPSSSEPDDTNHDTSAEASQGNRYPFPSVPGYAFENTAQTNTAPFSYAQMNSQMQNVAPFSSVMPYANTLPSNLVASTVQPPRESDIPYSPFLATPSMPTKYSTAMSSISGPTLSMPESLKPSVFSTPQPTPQTSPSSSIPTGPALPQHLPVHPYSQPTLPLGPYASMVSYPFLPPSYSFMPSAFQQAYAGNSAYHQSPAAVHSAGVKYALPQQYKNSVSMSSLPQSAGVASGYGGIGSSANLPGSFTLNPSTNPTSTTVGYEDVMSSHFKDSNHYLSLQQNEGSGMWVQGPGSRTVSALPASTYYSLQHGQNQSSGFRQGQQPSLYGALGYPNFYHSQAPVSQEHQQTPSNGTLNATQGPSSQPSNQIWQHSY